jgi:hypothetical protein
MWYIRYGRVGCDGSNEGRAGKEGKETITLAAAARVFVHFLILKEGRKVKEGEGRMDGKKDGRKGER